MGTILLHTINKFSININKPRIFLVFYYKIEKNNLGYWTFSSIFC
jgi:hypothetical protein